MRTRVRGVAIIVSLLAAALGAVAAAPSDAAAGPSQISCYFDYGSGVLKVRAPGVVLIRPETDVIAVADGRSRPIGCSGSLPRRGDTRTIIVGPSRPRQPVALGIDLRQAPLPPGVVVDARLGRGQMGIALGPASDRVAGGVLGGAAVLDLDFDGGLSADVVSNPAATLRLDAGEGDNVISLAGGGGFEGPWRSPTSLAGRMGADVIAGGAATDLIFGGDGPDRMFGLGGNDLLSAAGEGPDVVDCGAGRDIALASGPGDSVMACETRRRRLKRASASASRAAGLPEAPRQRTLPGRSAHPRH